MAVGLGTCPRAGLTPPFAVPLRITTTTLTTRAQNTRTPTTVGNLPDHDDHTSTNNQPQPTDYIHHTHWNRHDTPTTTTHSHNHESTAPQPLSHRQQHSTAPQPPTHQQQHSNSTVCLIALVKSASLIGCPADLARPMFYFWCALCGLLLLIVSITGSIWGHSARMHVGAASSDACKKKK